MTPSKNRRRAKTPHDSVP